VRFFLSSESCSRSTIAAPVSYFASEMTGNFCLGEKLQNHCSVGVPTNPCIRDRAAGWQPDECLGRSLGNTLRSLQLLGVVEDTCIDRARSHRHQKKQGRGKTKQAATAPLCCVRCCCCAGRGYLEPSPFRETKIREISQQRRHAPPRRRSLHPGFAVGRVKYQSINQCRHASPLQLPPTLTLTPSSSRTHPYLSLSPSLPPPPRCHTLHPFPLLFIPMPLFRSSRSLARSLLTRVDKRGYTRGACRQDSAVLGRRGRESGESGSERGRKRKREADERGKCQWSAHATTHQIFDYIAVGRPPEGKENMTRNIAGERRIEGGTEGRRGKGKTGGRGKGIERGRK